MNLRPLIAALVLLALGGLILYVARHSYWEETTVPAPLRGEAASNPFYAAQRLAEQLGATTERRRALGDALPAGDVTLVLAQWHWDLIDARRELITAWVESGGHLVIDRTLMGGADRIANWIGVRRTYAEPSQEDHEALEMGVPDDEAGPAADPRTQWARTCAAIQEVDAEGRIRASGRSLNVCKLMPFTRLVAEREIDWGYADGGLQALRVAAGRGTVTMLNMDAFGNRDLTRLDHARLFVEAVDLRRGRHIVFLSEHAHASLLQLIWQHGAPAVSLALLSLAALLWRGAVRFGPRAMPTPTARRSLAEQIRGTGQFILRLGGAPTLQAAAARALHEAASRRIARYASLTPAQRIAAIAARARLDAKALAQAIEARGARRAGDLAQAVELLETARRRILQPASRSDA